MVKDWSSHPLLGSISFIYSSSLWKQNLLSSPVNLLQLLPATSFRKLEISSPSSHPHQYLPYVFLWWSFWLGEMESQVVFICIYLWLAMLNDLKLFISNLYFLFWKESRIFSYCGWKHKLIYPQRNLDEVLLGNWNRSTYFTCRHIFKIMDFLLQTMCHICFMIWLIYLLIQIINGLHGKAVSNMLDNWAPHVNFPFYQRKQYPYFPD